MYLGDCVETLSTLPESSVDYSVFSPPFSQLYVYSDSERDLGNSKNNYEFFEHFMFVVKEVFRVLKDGRIVSVHCMNLPLMKERDGIIGLNDFRGDIIRAFQEVGFIYHSEVCIWKNPVVEMQRTKALGLLHKQLKKDSTMSRMGLPDYIVSFRKPGENKTVISHNSKEFSVDKWQEWASPIWMGIKQGDTLQRKSAREDKDEKHICPLQLDVIERCIELWSNKGEWVLDPFCGIGSVPYQAIRLGRKGIGIELKESYYEQAVKNIKNCEISNNCGINDVSMYEETEELGKWL